MNVYVRELVSALAHAGVDCTTYTRTWRDDLPAEVMIEPNHKVVHIPAGAIDMPKGDMISIVPQFTEGVLDHINALGGTDVVHANYWLSGLSGHSLKHELDVPLVSTFHTFARVKAEGVTQNLNSVNNQKLKSLVVPMPSVSVAQKKNVSSCLCTETLRERLKLLHPE
jgi:D-inositol-3-phosphate glycosyltransferase